MKRLYSSLNISEIGLLKSLIEEDGIPCFIRDERSSLAMGEVPFLDCMPELWVVDDADSPRAQALLEKWHGAEPAPAEPWTCPQCGTENEGQFGACWQCGYELMESV